MPTWYRTASRTLRSRKPPDFFLIGAGLSVPAAMRAARFSDAQADNRTLQQIMGSGTGHSSPLVHQGVEGRMRIGDNPVTEDVTVWFDDPVTTRAGSCCCARASGPSDFR